MALFARLSRRTRVSASLLLRKAARATGSSRLRALATKTKPPKKFLPGEVFISLKELEKYGPDSSALFQRIKRNVKREKYSGPLMAGGIVTTSVGGTLGGLLGAKYGRGLGVLPGSVVGIIPGISLIVYSLSTRADAIEKDLQSLVSVWKNFQGSRPNRLLNDHRFVFLIPDFKNNGFRLSPVKETTARAFLKLDYRFGFDVKAGERILVVNKETGNVVYPSKDFTDIQHFGPERRIGPADRRKHAGHDRRQPERYEVTREKTG